MTLEENKARITEMLSRATGADADILRTAHDRLQKETQNYKEESETLAEVAELLRKVLGLSPEDMATIQEITAHFHKTADAYAQLFETQYR